MHEIFLWLSSSFKALHSIIVSPLKKMPEEVEIFLSPQVACVLYFYLLVSAQWITKTRITQKRGTFHTC